MRSGRTVCQIPERIGGIEMSYWSCRKNRWMLVDASGAWLTLEICIWQEACGVGQEEESKSAKGHGRQGQPVRVDGILMLWRTWRWSGGPGLPWTVLVDSDSEWSGWSGGDTL